MALESPTQAGSVAALLLHRSDRLGKLWARLLILLAMRLASEYTETTVSCDHKVVSRRSRRFWKAKSLLDSMRRIDLLLVMDMVEVMVPFVCLRRRSCTASRRCGSVGTINSRRLRAALLVRVCVPSLR